MSDLGGLQSDEKVLLYSKIHFQYWNRLTKNSFPQENK